MVQVYTYLRDDLYDKLRAEATERCLSTSGMLRKVVMDRYQEAVKNGRD